MYVVSKSPTMLIADVSRARGSVSWITARLHLPRGQGASRQPEELSGLMRVQPNASAGFSTGPLSAHRPHGQTERSGGRPRLVSGEATFTERIWRSRPASGASTDPVAQPP